MRYWPLGYWGVQIAAVVAMLVGGGLVVHFMPGLTWTKAGILYAVLLVGAMGATVAYRYADEVILQTHKTAWLWGGLIGIIATVPVVIIFQWHLATIPLLMPHVGNGSSVYFTEGFVLPLLGQVTGFFIVWAYLNWRRRQQ